MTAAAGVWIFALRDLRYAEVPANVPPVPLDATKASIKNVLDDYEWWEYCVSDTAELDRQGDKSLGLSVFQNSIRARLFPHHTARHFVMPYIGYNPLSEGGESDVDNYLFTGNEIGLQRVTHADLFPELA